MALAKTSGRPYPPGQHPDLPPPMLTSGPLFWLRTNLFSSWLNSALTVLGLAFLVWIVPGFITWAILEMDPTGTSRQECEGDGACWAVIVQRWRVFVYGFFPDDEAWRLWLAAGLLPLAALPLLAPDLPYRARLFWFTLAYPVLVFWLLGGGLGLSIIENERWGGLMLNLVVGLAGIAASLPVGIALALGRRSEMPAIRILCTVFIEVVRGVPLITILFFSSVMLPLFLPDGANIDKLLRALIVVTLFSAAYVAEVVRGGLQAIPKGQVEAAQALGLGFWRTTILVVLPQALRITLPGLVNSFISLFKDTSLISIIGFLDIVGIADNTLNTRNWQGLSLEIYVFIAFVFWIICFSMSRYGIWLERRLDPHRETVNRPAEGAAP